MDLDKATILHLSSPLTWRGGEQQLYYLYQGLEKSGVNQIVYCPKGSELSQRIPDNQCITYKKRGGFDVLAAHKLAKICRQLKVDLIHCHDAHAHTTAVLSADLFRNRKPFVLSRRVDFAVGKSWFSKYKYNHRQIQSIICVSKAIENIVSKSITNQKIDLTTIHSGVNPLKFEGFVRGKLRQEYKIGKEKILVGNVAALADHKDYPTFLRTVLRLKNDTRFQFMIIGSGPMESEIKELTHEMKLGEHIIFTGFRNDLPEIFGDLDVLLFPSKTEGLGTSILDAFANKVLVVATNAGGIPEIVKHKETGMICPIGDDECLSKSITDLIENEELRNTVKKSATELLKDFTWESMVLKTTKHYRKILNN